MGDTEGTSRHRRLPPREPESVPRCELLRAAKLRHRVPEIATSAHAKGTCTPPCMCIPYHARSQGIHAQRNPCCGMPLTQRWSWYNVSSFHCPLMHLPLCVHPNLPLPRSQEKHVNNTRVRSAWTGAHRAQPGRLLHQLQCTAATNALWARGRQASGMLEKP